MFVLNLERVSAEGLDLGGFELRTFPPYSFILPLQGACL